MKRFFNSLNGNLNDNKNNDDNIINNNFEITINTSGTTGKSKKIGHNINTITKNIKPKNQKKNPKRNKQRRIGFQNISPDGPSN